MADAVGVRHSTAIVRGLGLCLLTPVTPFAALVLSLLLPSGRSQIVVTLFLVAFAFYVPVKLSSGNNVQDWFNGLWSFIFFLKHIVFLLSDSSDLKYLGHPVQKDPSKITRQDEDREPRYLKKLLWATSISSTLRGIGWSWQVKGCPTGAPLHYPRWKFVQQQLVRGLLFVALEDLLATITLSHMNSAWQRKDNIGVLLRVTLSWAMGFCSAWGFMGSYSIGAAGAVASGLFEPWQWPPLFGNWGNAYSIRNLWSSIWHQALRRTFQLPAIHLCRALKLQKGSLASRYTQLYIVFFLSAVAHAMGPYAAFGHEKGDMLSFCIQAVGITVEDAVIAISKFLGRQDNKRKPRMWEKAFGYFWVFSWFSITLTAYLDRQRSGLWREDSRKTLSHSLLEKWRRNT